MKGIVIEVPVKSIVIEDRWRGEYGDLNKLIQSIKEHGLLHPLVVTSFGQPEGSYRLLAGGRRYRCITSLGWETVRCTVLPTEDEYSQRLIELTENFDRKDLTWNEQLEVRNKLRKLMEDKFGKKVGRTESAPGVSLDDIAAVAGVDKSTLSKDAIVTEAIARFPELARCKTKEEVLKAIKHMGHMIDKKKSLKAAEKFTTQTTIGTALDSKKQLAINSFIVDANFDDKTPLLSRGFFKAAKNLEKRSFDIIELDPPYGIELHTRKKPKDRPTEHYQYNEVAIAEYRDFIGAMIKECSRLLKPTGWFLLWFGFDWYGVIRDLLIEEEFRVPGVPAAWYKGQSGSSNSPDTHLASSYEAFIYARKGPATFNPARFGRSNVFDFKPLLPERKWHPTQRPIALMQEIFMTFGKQGAKICIPCAGSGTGILAGLNLGMYPVAFELSNYYKASYSEFVMKNTTGIFSDGEVAEDVSDSTDKK